MRVGTGYDSHKLTEGRKLILGGVEVPHEKGLLGHSDADVLTHAIIDAIIGALGLGDIGKHFPDTDQEFKDIDSRILLRKVVEALEKHNLSVGNVDLTIIAQAPKLASYIQSMRETLAEDLRIDVTRCNVKATTTEGMGFVGRSEGIAAHAVVLLKED